MDTFQIVVLFIFLLGFAFVGGIWVERHTTEFNIYRSLSRPDRPCPTCGRKNTRHE